MSTLPAPLAENNFGDTVPNGVAGPLGLFITILLVIATVLLIRNMNARLRRLPQSFPPPAGQTGRTETVAPPESTTKDSAEPATSTAEPPPAG
ncbi:MAG TPA: hypothetical protein VJT31_17285 [Rugosimonospora sp.]|nr:hypothetical protein [Rugosimonospora sp.]